MIDLFIRFSAIAILVMFIMLLLRDARNVKHARWGIVLGIFQLQLLFMKLRVQRVGQIG